jgi:hypothetical protein
LEIFRLTCLSIFGKVDAMSNPIKELISSGKTISEISIATQLGKTSIYEHANGKRKISATAAKAYMKAFDIPLKNLMPDFFAEDNSK